MSFFYSVFFLIFFSINTSATRVETEINDVLRTAEKASTLKDAQGVIQPFLHYDFSELTETEQNHVKATKEMLLIFLDNSKTFLDRQKEITDVLENSLALMEEDKIPGSITMVTLKIIGLIAREQERIKKIPAKSSGSQKNNENLDHNNLSH